MQKKCIKVWVWKTWSLAFGKVQCFSQILLESRFLYCTAKAFAPSSRRCSISRARIVLLCARLPSRDSSIFEGSILNCLFMGGILGSPKSVLGSAQVSFWFSLWQMDLFGVNGGKLCLFYSNDRSLYFWCCFTNQDIEWRQRAEVPVLLNDQLPDLYLDSVCLSQLGLAGTPYLGSYLVSFLQASLTMFFLP